MTLTKKLTMALMLTSAAALAQEDHVFHMAIPAPPPGAGANMGFAFQSSGGDPGRLNAVMTEFVGARFAFEGKPVKGAPYSAEAVTETTQALADGNRISHKNSSVMYRDSEGRTRREESMPAIGPWAAPGEP